jgi:signal peptidase
LDIVDILRKEPIQPVQNPAFREAVGLLNAGELDRARLFLKEEVTQKDPGNTAAWAMLAQLSAKPAERAYCLSQVLRLKPGYPWAEEGLRMYQAGNGGNGANRTKDSIPQQDNGRSRGGGSGSSTPEQDQAIPEPAPSPTFEEDVKPHFPTPAANLNFCAIVLRQERPKQSAKKRPLIVQALGAVIDVALISVLLVAIMLLVAPRLMGAQLLVIQSQSMEPQIQMGSIVISQPVDDPTQLRPGEAITFVNTGPFGEISYITHRIIERVGEGAEVRYRTQGDASEEPDQGSIAPGDVVGEVWFSVPYAGFLAGAIRTPLGYALLVGLPALVIILGELKAMLQVLREKEPPTLISQPLKAKREFA